MVPWEKYSHVRCHGLLGTYNDAIIWLQQPENLDRPKCVVSLGSSIGSFTRTEAARFLSRFAEVLKSNRSSANVSGEDSSIIIGLDACKSKDKVHRAYNDGFGLNAKFILNTLRHANAIIGENVFRLGEWVVRGEWNETTGSHDQYLVPLKDVIFENTCFKAGGRVLATHSHKYNANEQDQLWRRAALTEIERWVSKDNSYGKCSYTVISL